MRYLKILNLTRSTILAEKAVIADSLFSRLQGLLGRDSLASSEGLILKPCDSIHTFFMRFPIDVVFVDKNNRVIRLYHSLKPWRLSGIFLRAAFCLELPARTLQFSFTQKGDQIEVSTGDSPG
jgi:uncharacterized protein